MARSRRELNIAQFFQLPAHRRHIKRYRKFVIKPPGQINQPPAHNAMDGRDRAALNYFDKRSALRIIEQRLSARCLAIDQPAGTTGVEAKL